MQNCTMNQYAMYNLATYRMQDARKQHFVWINADGIHHGVLPCFLSSSAFKNKRSVFVPRPMAHFFSTCGSFPATPSASPVVVPASCRIVRSRCVVIALR